MKRLYILATAAFIAVTLASNGPFLTALDNQTWIIGNEIWNMTQGPIYGVKLNYKEKDLVGDAAGHYVSYSKPPPPLQSHHRKPSN